MKNPWKSNDFHGFLVEAPGFEPTTLWSRTRRATSCATPRFFSFLSVFVSGQTCGQATYFERFVEKCTARIVSVVKGFRGSKKTTKKSPCGCPERDALLTALRLGFSILYLFRKRSNRLFWRCSNYLACKCIKNDW